MEEMEEEGEEGEECEENNERIDLPSHEELINMNQEEGIFLSLRDCPHLKDFSDEELR